MDENAKNRTMPDIWISESTRLLCAVQKRKMNEGVTTSRKITTICKWHRLGESGTNISGRETITTGIFEHKSLIQFISFATTYHTIRIHIITLTAVCSHTGRLTGDGTSEKRNCQRLIHYQRAKIKISITQAIEMPSTEKNPSIRGTQKECVRVYKCTIARGN